MKKLIYLTLSLCCLLSCNSVVEKTSLEEMNLNGKIKSIMISRFEANVKFGEISRGDYVYYAAEMPLCYNESPYGYTESVIDIHFDVSGFFESIYSYNEDLDLEKKDVFVWSGANLLKTITYDESDVISLVENTFEKNRIISSVHITEYDTIRYQYKTDDNGVIEECVVYNGKEEFQCKWKNTIEKNKVIKEEFFSKDVEKPIITSLVYENEKLIELISVDRKKYFFYNEYGDIEKYLDDDDEFIFKYEYDDKNNWVKRITYKGIKPLYIEEREIVYF